jgi:hypothetical protein
MSNPFYFAPAAKLALENPQYWQKQFAQFLEAMGINSEIPKTLATFADFGAATLATLQAATIYDNITDANEHFLIFGFQLLDGSNATLSATDWVPGISDASAKNGNLTIANNGTDEVRLPLTTFVPETQNEAQQTVWYLPKPVFQIGQTPLKARVELPAVPLTADYNLAFQPFGFKLIS